MRINLLSLFVLLALVVSASIMAQEPAPPPQAVSAPPTQTESAATSDTSTSPTPSIPFPPAPLPPPVAPAPPAPPPAPPEQAQIPAAPAIEPPPQLPERPPSAAGSVAVVPPPAATSPMAPVLPPAATSMSSSNSMSSPGQSPGRLEDMIQTALANNPDIQVAEAKLHEADVALVQVRQQVVRELTQSFQERTKSSMQLDAARERLRQLEGSGATDLERQDPQLKVRALEAELAANQAQLRYLLGAALEGPQPTLPQPGPNMEPTPQPTGPPMGGARSSASGTRGFGGMGGMGGGAWSRGGPGGSSSGGWGSGAWSSGSSGGLGGGSIGGYGGGMSGGYCGSSGGWGRAVGASRLPAGAGSPRPPIPDRYRKMLDAAQRITVDIDQQTPLDQALGAVREASGISFVFAATPFLDTFSFNDATCEEVMTAFSEAKQNEICFVFRDYGVLVTGTEQAMMIPGATIPSYIPYLGPPTETQPGSAPDIPAKKQP